LRITEGLLGQLSELSPLIGRHRLHHPLRRSRSGSQKVDQFIDGLRVLGKEISMPAQKLPKLLAGIVPGRVGGEKCIEVSEHLPNTLGVSRCDLFQRLLHAGKALIHHFSTQKILNLPERFSGIGGLPVVFT